MCCKHNVCEKCEREKREAEELDREARRIMDNEAPTLSFQSFYVGVAVLGLTLACIIISAYTNYLTFLNPFNFLVAMCIGVGLPVFYAFRHQMAMKKFYRSLSPKKAEIMKKAGYYIP